MMKIQAKELNAFCIAVLRKAGFSEEEALHTAHSLSFAELRGLGRYGYRNLKRFADGAKSGDIRCGVQIRAEAGAPGLLRIDGEGGAGPYVIRKSMDLCIRNAKENGCCFAAVRGLCAPGLGAYVNRYAMEDHCVTVFFSGEEEDPEGLHVSAGLPAGKGYPPVIKESTEAGGTDSYSFVLRLLRASLCGDGGVLLGAVSLEALPGGSKSAFAGLQKEIDALRSSGLENDLPGMKAHLHFHEWNTNGVPVSGELLSELRGLEKEYGISLPDALEE